MQPPILTIPKPLAPVADVVNTAVSAGKLGAVVARAGVGKTSFLVQAAIYSMMTEKNVLHINLTDTVKKTALWYNEVFSLMTEKCRSAEPVQPLEPLLVRRLIMTMKIAGFSIDAVRERLMDFIEQDVFSPQMIVLDGLRVDASGQDTVAAFKELARELSVVTWLSVPAHREESRDDRNRPASFAAVADQFDVAWELLPEGGKIHVRSLPTGQESPADPGLYLNPSTLLLNVEKS